MERSGHTFPSDRIPLLFTTPINLWVPPTLLLLPLLLLYKPKKRKSTGPGEVSPYFFPYWALRYPYREVEIFFDLCSFTPKACLLERKPSSSHLKKWLSVLLQKSRWGISKKIPPNLREHPLPAVGSIYIEFSMTLIRRPSLKNAPEGEGNRKFRIPSTTYEFPKRYWLRKN